MNLLVELAVNFFCPLVVFFAHELHECEHYGLWALVLWRSAFQAHQPSLPIRGLRPRLLSLRSVLPSRQIVLNEIFCPRIARIGTNAMRGCFMTTTGKT